MSASRVVVVGASCAGLSAAEAMRRSGWAGELVLLGDEAGPPYDRPPLSKGYLLDEPEPNVQLRSTEAIEALRLLHRTGVSATGLDTATRTVVATDGTYEADGVVVATGVRARRLDWLEEDPRVRYLRNLEDATQLRRDLRERRGALAVLGGGPLGLEAAATANALGWDVQLVEAGPQVMPTMLGARLAERVVEHHRRRGIGIRTSITATSLTPGGLLLSSGETLEVDLCLVAIGAVPNTEWLVGADDVTLDNGVVCDAYGEAAPFIYGAGDVARWMHPQYGRLVRLESRTNAVRQAMTSAGNLLADLGGAPEKKATHGPEAFFWSDQGELRLKAFGDVGGADRTCVDAGEDAGLTLFGGPTRSLVGFAALGAPLSTISSLRAAMAASRSVADVLEDLGERAEVTVPT